MTKLDKIIQCIEQQLALEELSCAETEGNQTISKLLSDRERAYSLLQLRENRRTAQERGSELYDRITMLICTIKSSNSQHPHELRQLNRLRHEYKQVTGQYYQQIVWIDGSMEEK